MRMLLALVLLAAPLAAALSYPPAPLQAPGSDDAWARALVAAFPRATFVNDEDGDKLFDDLETRLDPLERTRVVVTFVQGVTTEEGLARVRAVAPEAPVARAFRILPAYAGALRLDEALRVAALPEVRQVEHDAEGAPELDTATLVMGADAVVDGLGIDGTGVNIAILDTGFDGKHVDLADGKIVRFVDIGDGKDGEPYDSGGHGTHVASIAAGWGRGKAEYRGVAPGAGIVGLRIDGGGDVLSNAIAGYEWVFENREAYNIRVVTMSFGFGIAKDGTSALELAVDKVWDAGVVAFKSNGNSGPGRGTMTIPSAARGILGIGSMLDPAGSTAGLPLVGNPGAMLPPAKGFILSSYSSRGPTTDGRVKPDLVAPGQAIMAAANGTTDKYVALSGTSMASPFAAGTAALMIAANPSLTPDQVRDLLIATADDWGVQGPDVDYGHGRIRVRDAVLAALELRGARPAESPEVVSPFHETRAGVVANGPAVVPIEVNDTTHAIAVTVIAEGTLLAVEIRDPSGAPIGKVSSPVPTRQAVTAIEPQKAGKYELRVLAPPGTPFVADFSHGIAPGLPDIVEAVRPLRAGEALGAVEDPRATVPGASVALAVGATMIALLLRRR